MRLNFCEPNSLVQVLQVNTFWDFESKFLFVLAFVVRGNFDRVRGIVRSAILVPI